MRQLDSLQGNGNTMHDHEVLVPAGHQDWLLVAAMTAGIFALDGVLVWLATQLPRGF
ncbi:MAG: hypothetical protein HY898_03285 [Deltaproteobacteria bacterium]|nr:hypothetical protein [Deltaproteobacteria bacterium]